MIEVGLCINEFLNTTMEWDISPFVCNNDLFFSGESYNEFHHPSEPLRQQSNIISSLRASLK